MKYIDRAMDRFAGEPERHKRQKTRALVRRNGDSDVCRDCHGNMSERLQLDEAHYSPEKGKSVMAEIVYLFLWGSRQGPRRICDAGDGQTAVSARSAKACASCGASIKGSWAIRELERSQDAGREDTFWRIRPQWGRGFCERWAAREGEEQPTPKTYNKNGLQRGAAGQAGAFGRDFLYFRAGKI